MTTETETAAEPPAPPAPPPIHYPKFQRQSPAMLQRGRKPRIESNHRNVYRYAAGWYLNKWFRGRRYAEYFSDVMHGGDENVALAAASERRDWLDSNRKRILDRLGVEIARRMFGKRGRRVGRNAKVSKTPISIKAVVRSVELDIERRTAAMEAMEAMEVAVTSTASPSVSSE